MVGARRGDDDADGTEDVRDDQQDGAQEGAHDTATLAGLLVDHSDADHHLAEGEPELKAWMQWDYAKSEWHSMK